MKKIVIVMTYYNRAMQLTKTLETICKTKHTNYEIVVVNDGSEAHIHHEGVHEIYIPKEEKKWVTPVIPQNMGVQKAIDIGAEIIILQNAECFHVGDILMYANDNLTEENYFTFGCFSLDEASTVNQDIDNILPELIKANNKDATSDGSLAWYNHPFHRGVCYDFCAAITVNNIKRLNGYDERFSNFISYSDDNLISRIRKMKLFIDIPKPEENPFCVHQWHYSGESQYSKENLVIGARNLFESIIKTEGENFKAVHTTTKDFS